jgi:type IV pilus assembly protein PilA
MLNALRTKKGFTLIEIMMAMIILAVLATMSMNFFFDLQSRSYDAVAIADGKNLMTSVGNAFILLENVDLNHAPGDGSEVGTMTVGGEGRSKLVQLSPGVQAVIFGESTSIPGTSGVSAYLWHENGTDDGSSLSGNGKREFYFAIDEFSSSISVPQTGGG